jgi:hypothetical protein
MLCWAALTDIGVVSPFVHEPGLVATRPHNQLNQLAGHIAPSPSPVDQHHKVAEEPGPRRDNVRQRPPLGALARPDIRQLLLTTNAAAASIATNAFQLQEAEGVQRNKHGVAASCWQASKQEST